MQDVESAYPGRRCHLYIPACAVLVAFSMVNVRALAQWSRWGGPDRNFIVDTSGLADSWPERGPRKLWNRALGSGFSSIVADGGMLFTMYRAGKKDLYEVTIALDAKTGETIWQKRQLAAIPASNEEQGKEFTGPNATPLVVSDRLYTIGRNAVLHCFQKRDGSVLWKHELQRNFGAQIEPCGYSCSPMAYGSTIIVPLGRAENDTREGNSLIALDQATGEVVWRSQTFRICHSSPIIINLDGEDHVVVCTREGVIGVDPASGKLLWQYVIPEQEFGCVVATPVWNGEDVLQCSSGRMGYGIRLAKDQNKTNATLLWSSSKAPLGMGTPVLIDGMLVGSKRVSGANLRPLMGVDIRTGKRLWIDRALAMPVPIGNAGKLILLDGEGKLGLATATREGLTIHSQCQLTERWSFTSPTLAGSTLYVRDEKHIMALDLSPEANSRQEGS